MKKVIAIVFLMVCLTSIAVYAAENDEIGMTCRSTLVNIAATRADAEYNTELKKSKDNAIANVQQYKPIETDIYNIRNAKITAEVNTLVNAIKTRFEAELKAAEEEQKKQEAEKKAEEQKKVATMHTTASIPSGNARDAFNKLVAEKGLAADEIAFWAFVIEHESGWQVNATNSSSGAYGLPQSLPAEKMASHGADWRTNPETQLRWMYDYMVSRYGGIRQTKAFWDRNHWY